MMPRYLIVANQTLGGEQLTAKMDELISGGAATFRLLAPVTQTEGLHQWDYPPIDRAIPDAATIARSLAEGRLEHELARLRRTGVEATGEVVEAEPVDNIVKLLREERFDGVVISTLPRRLSRWMIMDLPHRVSRASDVPVMHVEGAAGPSL
jgi:nucleotide-binding universal stress UspA family protein